MKKLNRKLTLNKQTIARLNDDSQASIYGGGEVTDSCAGTGEGKTCRGYTCEGINCYSINIATCQVPIETVGCPTMEAACNQNSVQICIGRPTV